MKCLHCPSKARCKGLCFKHYQRLKRYGRTERIEKDWKGKPRKYQYKSIGAMHKKRFGGLREFILKRDEYKCVLCGMTRRKHKNLWGRDLTLHHINGEGRNSPQPDNTKENLITLCLRDHGRIDKINSLY